MESARFVLWTMIACQLAAWGWFSLRGGKLSDRNFLVFTAGMLLGQIGAGIETFVLHAWGTFTVQIFFLVFTFIGGCKRFHAMRRSAHVT